MQVINFFPYIIFSFLWVQVAYLLFFSVAGKIARSTKIPVASKQKRIKVFIPGYKEDKVIYETALSALTHDYPAEKFEVIVIADSFSPATLQLLHQLPIKTIEVSFEKSTKGKALKKALEETMSDNTDIAVVLDADNIMAPGFLHAVNNAYEHGYHVMQGHRTALTPNTPFALLDGCTEEINNHIFRRGHVAVGLPSALIGSGMAFDFKLFTSILQNIGDTAGEDKEMEFRIIRQRHKIAFLDGAYVYDEKVAREEVFSKQRSRWISVQIEFFRKYFLEGWQQLFKGNVAFFDKVFQTYLLPRVLLVVACSLAAVTSFLFFNNWVIESVMVLTGLAFSLLIGIPVSWYNKRLLMAFLKIPSAFISFLLAMFLSRRAKHQFIHTPHGETTIN